MCKIAKVIMAVFLLFVGYKDWKTKQISCLSIVAMAVMAIVFRCIAVEDTWWSTLGGIAIGICFFAMSKFSRESVGYGDSWMILLLGIFVGGKRLLGIIVTATFLTSLVSILGCIKHGWNKKKTIPFVPFLAVAYMVVMFL